jgi:hypothetical protein
MRTSKKVRGGMLIPAGLLKKANNIAKGIRVGMFASNPTYHLRSRMWRVALFLPGIDRSVGELGFGRDGMIKNTVDLSSISINVDNAFTDEQGVK